jgi:hypothetical protein
MVYNCVYYCETCYTAELHRCLAHQVAVFLTYTLTGLFAQRITCFHFCTSHTIGPATHTCSWGLHVKGPLLIHICVSMCVCMYVCVCVCVYVCIHTHIILLCMYVCIHTYTHIIFPLLTYRYLGVARIGEAELKQLMNGADNTPNVGV